MSVDSPRLGERREFPNGYSLPHLSVYVPAGAVGTVVYADEYTVSVRLDEPIENLHDSEWKNCIDFAVSDDPGCVERYTVTADPIARAATLGIVPPNPSVNMPAFAVDMIDAQGNGDVSDAVLGIRGKVLDLGSGQDETTVYVVAVSREEASMVAVALDQWSEAISDGDVETDTPEDDAWVASHLAKRFGMVPQS